MEPIVANAARGSSNGNRARFEIIDLWRLPMDFFELPLQAQFEAVAKATRPAEPIVGMRMPCPMSVSQQAQFIVWSSVTLGLPLLMVPITAGLSLFRPSWLKFWFAGIAMLAFHPLPAYRLADRRNSIGLILARYFSMTIVVDRSDPFGRILGTPAVDMESHQAELPIIPVACPHGVLNFGAIIWVFFSRWISGHDQYTAGAPVVGLVPGLRYLTSALWICHADRKSLKKHLQERPNGVRRGGVVGIVPDGIAGIFYSKPGQDVLHLGPKRGLMRIAFEEGALLAAGWFPGTTDCFTVVQDPFGMMQWISRKLKIAIFLFYGRWGMPIPRRTPTSMCSIIVRAPKNAEPSDADLDKLHSQVYDGLAKTYDELKHFVGYSDRSLIIS